MCFLIVKGLKGVSDMNYVFIIIVRFILESTSTLDVDFYLKYCTQSYCHFLAKLL